MKSLYLLCTSSILTALILLGCNPEAARYNENESSIQQVTFDISLEDGVFSEISQDSISSDGVIHFDVLGRSFYQLEPVICCFEGRTYKSNELLDDGFFTYWKDGNNLSRSQYKQQVFTDSLSEILKYQVWITDIHNDTLGYDIWLHVDTSFRPIENLDVP